LRLRLCPGRGQRQGRRRGRAPRRAAAGLLRDAVTKGWKNADHMKKDSDLDSLRKRDDFQKLLAELEKK
jgi:hypothetical protein